MPRKNDLPSFGPEFEQLLLRAHSHLLQGHDEFPIDFTSQSLASSLRFRVYSYFKALRDSTSRPDLTALQTPLSLRVQGCTLFIYRRGEDTDAMALRIALGLPKGFADGPRDSDVLLAPTTLDKHRERLRTIRDRSSKS